MGCEKVGSLGLLLTPHQAALPSWDPLVGISRPTVSLCCPQGVPCGNTSPNPYYNRGAEYSQAAPLWPATLGMASIIHALDSLCTVKLIGPVQSGNPPAPTPPCCKSRRLHLRLNHTLPCHHVATNPHLRACWPFLRGNWGCLRDLKVVSTMCGTPEGLRCIPGCWDQGPKPT